MAQKWVQNGSKIALFGPPGPVWAGLGRSGPVLAGPAKRGPKGVHFERKNRSTPDPVWAGLGRFGPGPARAGPDQRPRLRSDKMGPFGRFGPARARDGPKYPFLAIWPKGPIRGPGRSRGLRFLRSKWTLLEPFWPGRPKTVQTRQKGVKKGSPGPFLPSFV